MSASTGLQYARSVRRRHPGLRRNSSASKIDILNTIPEGEIATNSPVQDSGDERVPLVGGAKLKRIPLDRVDEAQSCRSQVMTFFRHFLSTSVVLTSVAQTVTLPLYSDIMNDVKTGSDPFIAFFLASMWLPVIFWILLGLIQIGTYKCDYQLNIFQVSWMDVIVAAILAAISQVLVALSSLPDRTPAYMQAIFLQSLMVPFTALARYLILNKTITKKQFACIILLFMGIAMTLIPTMSDPDVSGLTYIQSNDLSDQSGGSWYFYIIFAFSCVPLACAYAMLEKGQKTHSSNSFVVTAWFKTFVCVSYLLLFWLDFLPGFGSSDYPGDFGYHVSEGFKCFYGMYNAQCRSVSLIAVTYILSYASNTFLSILLINLGDGSLYTVIILVLALPLSTLFWTLFSALPELHWNPSFSSSTAFVVIGLVVIIPAVMLFHEFREDLSKPRPTRKRSRPYPHGLGPPTIRKYGRYDSLEEGNLTTSSSLRLSNQYTTIPSTTSQRDGRLKRPKSAPTLTF